MLDRRPYEGMGEGPQRLKTPNKIKIGVKGSNDAPERLRGFLIVSANVDTKTKKNYPRFDLMEALGYPRVRVEEGINKAYSAPDGCLPDTLVVSLRGNAEKDGDRWRFPLGYEEAYQAHDGKHLVCSGNGIEAWRLVPVNLKVPGGGNVEGFQRQCIQCVPCGTSGVDPSEWCPISNATKNLKGYKGPMCKLRAHPVFHVLRVNPSAPENCAPWLRYCLLDHVAQSSYSLDSGSIQTAENIVTAMTAAAERLDGWVDGLVGFLRLTWERASNGNMTNLIVPRIQLEIMEGQIRDREAAQAAFKEAQRGNRLEEYKVTGGLLLDGPVPTHPPAETIHEVSRETPVPADSQPKPTPTPTPTPSPAPQVQRDPDPEPEAPRQPLPGEPDDDISRASDANVLEMLSLELEIEAGKKGMDKLELLAVVTAPLMPNGKGLGDFNSFHVFEPGSKKADPVKHAKIMAIARGALRSLAPPPAPSAADPFGPETDDAVEAEFEPVGGAS